MFPYSWRFIGFMSEAGRLTFQSTGDRYRRLGQIARQLLRGGRPQAFIRHDQSVSPPWSFLRDRNGLNSSSRFGVVAYADSLDCVGILARDVDSVSDVYGKSTSQAT